MKISTFTVLFMWHFHETSTLDIFTWFYFHNLSYLVLKCLHKKFLPGLYFHISMFKQIYVKIKSSQIARGQKGHISCTWVQCAIFLRNRPRQTFLFTDQPEKHRGVEGIEILLPVKFCWIPFSRSRKCLSQSEARAAILFFQSAWKTQTW